jgi:hypothetical protein
MCPVSHRQSAEVPRPSRWRLLQWAVVPAVLLTVSCGGAGQSPAASAEPSGGPTYAGSSGGGGNPAPNRAGGGGGRPTPTKASLLDRLWAEGSEGSAIVHEIPPGGTCSVHVDVVANPKRSGDVRQAKETPNGDGTHKAEYTIPQDLLDDGYQSLTWTVSCEVRDREQPQYVVSSRTLPPKTFPGKESPSERPTSTSKATPTPTPTPPPGRPSVPPSRSPGG